MERLCEKLTTKDTKGHEEKTTGATFVILRVLRGASFRKFSGAKTRQLAHTCCRASPSATLTSIFFLPR